MRRKTILAVGLSSSLVVGCSSTTGQSRGHRLAHDPYLKEQVELREVLDGIVRDLATANVTGLRDSHLKSEKFTKFGGRRYERLDFRQCTDGETANLTAVQEYKYEPRDVKIDVFGDVAVMTYYPHVTAKKNGEIMRYSSRQTLVFLKTPDGWKIVHEHQSQKNFEE